MSAPAAEAAPSTDIAKAVQEYVMGHVGDSQEWHLPFLHLHLPGFISLHGVMLVLCTVFLILIFGVFYKKDRVVPRGFTNLLEVLVLFVRDEICIANLGEKDGRRMAPLFCSFFFFILGLNLMGLIPLFSTATANLSVTMALAISTLAFMFIAGIQSNGAAGFFKSFAPPGVPAPILVLLVPLEFLGMFVKAFALMIRLFANMIAGHIVLFSILGLIIMFGNFVAPPAIFLASGIFCLELFVALLQAYIFTLLSAMFIGQTMHPEH